MRHWVGESLWVVPFLSGVAGWALSSSIRSDISIRALSPSVNDPTSSVQALKGVHELLGDLAGRRLGPWSPRGPRGRVRLVLDGPDWEDYLAIGLAETVIARADALIPDGQGFRPGPRAIRHDPSAPLP